MTPTTVPPAGAPALNDAPFVPSYDRRTGLNFTPPPLPRDDLIVFSVFFFLVAYASFFGFFPFSGASITETRSATLGAAKYVSGALGFIMAGLVAWNFRLVYLKELIPYGLYSASILVSVFLRKDWFAEMERTVPMAVAVTTAPAVGLILFRNPMTALSTFRLMTVAASLLYLANVLLCFVLPGAGLPFSWGRDVTDRGFLFVEIGFIPAYLAMSAFLYVQLFHTYERYFVGLMGFYSCIYTSTRTYHILTGIGTACVMILYPVRVMAIVLVAVAAVLFVLGPGNIESFLFEKRIYVPTHFDIESLDMILTGRAKMNEILIENFLEAPWFGMGQDYVKQEMVDLNESGIIKGHSEYGIALHFAAYGMFVGGLFLYCMARDGLLPFARLLGLYLRSPKRYGQDYGFKLAHTYATLGVVSCFAALLWLFAQGNAGNTWCGLLIFGANRAVYKLWPRGLA